jgi:adenylate cyclase
MALELRGAVHALAAAAEPPIGLARGLMRVGSFGGPTRRAFGALGDDVNLAARLMQTAAPGEILLAPQVQRAAAQHFRFEPRPPLPMRGKQEPLPVFALIGAASVRPLRLQEPDHPLPMIGRHGELQAITEALKHARNGHVQAVVVVGEAGIGKSRLLIEAIRAALRLGFACYAGACQSDGVHTPYLPWKPVWSAFFGVDPMAPLRRNLRALEQEAAERAPLRLQALPLLARMLGMTEVEENDFTRTLPPAARRDVLGALLDDCLKHAAHEEPLLVVLEDIHCIDPLSLDLLDRLFRSATGLRVCFLVSSRKLPAESDVEERLSSWPAVRRIELSELNRDECAQAIRAKLAQLYPDREGAPPGVLIDRLVAHSQGNPFYLEELLNYLRDRGLDPRTPEHIARIELPESLHALVLSRIDQLSPDEQATLRAASIVGRSFPAPWVAGYCPELGDLAVLKARLDRLHAADITTVEAPESDLRYLFKHVVVHDATYQSLPFSTRSDLHGRLAAYLESAVEGALPLDTLAYHYARSGDVDKQREYLRKAGDAARREYANTTALAHYTQLLPLLDKPAESIEVLRLCVEVRELMGDFNQAEQDALQALAIARSAGDNPSLVRMKTLLGRLCRHRGDSDAAFDWLAQARAMATDPAERARAIAEEGIAHHRRGEFNAARERLNESLAEARRAGDDAEAARSLNYLGLVATSVGDKEGADALFQESIALRLASGDRWSIANSLNNLGNLACDRSDYDAARALYEKSLALKREIGDRWGVSASVGNLGLIALMKGDHAAARTLLENSLELSRELGDRWTEACMLGNLGKLQCDLGQTVAARRLLTGSLELSRSINDGWGIAASLCDLGRVSLLEGDLDSARRLLADSFDRGQQMGEKQVSSNAQMLLGLVELQRGADCDVASARAWIMGSLRLRLETGERVPLVSSLVCAAALAQHQGHAETAALLLGAVDAALAAMKVPVEAEVRSWRARTLVDARDAMGQAAFDAACARGAAVSLDDATRLAEASHPDDAPSPASGIHAKGAHDRTADAA